MHFLIRTCFLCICFYTYTLPFSRHILYVYIFLIQTCFYTYIFFLSRHVLYVYIFLTHTFFIRICFSYPCICFSYPCIFFYISSRCIIQKSYQFVNVLLFVYAYLLNFINRLIIKHILFTIHGYTKHRKEFFIYLNPLSPHFFTRGSRSPRSVTSCFFVSITVYLIMVSDRYNRL